MYCILIHIHIYIIFQYILTGCVRGNPCLLLAEGVRPSKLFQSAFFSGRQSWIAGTLQGIKKGMLGNLFDFEVGFPLQQPR